jgi:hypothetical protein
MYHRLIALALVSVFLASCGSGAADNSRSLVTPTPTLCAVRIEPDVILREGEPAPTPTFRYMPCPTRHVAPTPAGTRTP